jgi:hypothetical protein
MQRDVQEEPAMSEAPGVTGEDALRPARWFHLEGTERRGPVGLDEMRELVLEGTLVPRSWVWADGMDDWMRVADVPALVPPRALRVTLTDWPDEPGD